MKRRSYWAMCGAGYSALVLHGLLGGGGGELSTDAQFQAYYADAGNRTSDFVFFGEMLVAALLLLVFTAGLQERIAAAGAGIAASLVQAAGATGAALLSGSAAIAVSVSAAAGRPGFTVDADSAKLVGEIFWATFTASVVMVGLLVAAFSVAVLRTRTAPRWLAWTGLPVAVLSLGAMVFFPILLLLVWLAVAGVALLVLRPARPVRSQASPETLQPA